MNASNQVESAFYQGSDLNSFLLGLLRFITKDGKQIPSPSQPSVCGLVWGGGETAYKCNTCQMDPTWYSLMNNILDSNISFSAICLPCFRGGKHEGHDCIIY
jgi:Putative zinc finger in N-recognin (UBR box)